MADFSNAGTALKVGNGASPEVFTTIASITDHGDLALTRTGLDTTKLSSTVRTSKAGLQSIEDLSLEGTYDPSDTQVDGLWTAITTQNQVDKNYQLVLSTSPAETWEFGGYVREFRILGNTPDNLIRFSATLAINTVPTVS